MPILLVYLLAAGSAFLPAFLLFLKTGQSNRVANRWFGLFLLSAGFTLLEYFAWHGHYNELYPRLIPFAEITRFALAPALYLGVWHFTHIQRIRSYALAIHFLPVFIFFLFTVPYLFPGSFTSYMNLKLMPDSLSRIFGRIVAYSIPAQFLVYWIMSVLLLKNHQRKVLLITSDTNRIDLKWLSLLLLSIGLLMLLWFNQLLFPGNPVSQYSAYGYLIFIYIMSYFLLTQQEVFAFNPVEKEMIREILEDKKTTIKPVQPRLSHQEMLDLQQRLDQLLIKDKAFTDEQIDLSLLAAKMGLPVHDLSFLINEGYKMNFFSLINFHRIEEAKRLLCSERHQQLTVLAIAYEVGFASKTTFNTAFKKYTGQTPTAFIKNSR